MVDQAAWGGLDHIQHLLESLRPAVTGVRDLLLRQPREIEEQLQLVPVLRAFSFSLTVRRKPACPRRRR